MECFRWTVWMSLKIKMKIITKLALPLYAAVMSLNTAFAQTQPCDNSGDGIRNPLTSCTFEDLMNTVADWLVLLAIPIVSIMFLYGGFQMMTAAGDPGKIEKGKHTLTYAVWGFVAVLLAKGAALIIKEIIGA